jgi:hypothetical protein
MPPARHPEQEPLPESPHKTEASPHNRLQKDQLEMLGRGSKSFADKLFAIPDHNATALC